MSSEPKAFASLSSGLLARKGAARPAMRPQGFGQIGSAGLEDLGWNDMGFEAPKPAIAPVRDEDHDAFGDELPTPALRNPVGALTPVVSPVHNQQAEIAGRLGIEADEDEEVDETAEPFEAEVTAEVSPLTIRAKPAPEPVAPTPFPAAVARPVRARRPRAAPGSKAKAAFTLRLDADRHLKLRLACAVDGRSAQMLVTEALDMLLASMPELDGMADRAPKKRAAN
ncbi:MAG TPA: hypothetical protein VHM21_00620 [Sphingomicrobium sp.]|jgi:hypothetical protein|nr:hypothetical protein [Sphingomicrobium sp.]